MPRVPVENQITTLSVVKIAIKFSPCSVSKLVTVKFYILQLKKKQNKIFWQFLNNFSMHMDVSLFLHSGNLIFVKFFFFFFELRIFRLFRIKLYKISKFSNNWRYRINFRKTCTDEPKIYTRTKSRSAMFNADTENVHIKPAM